MAQPPLAVSALMESALASHNLVEPLGPLLFARENWHQSLSIDRDYGPEDLAAMLRAGARVAAPAFSMTLNRIRGDRAGLGPIHWAFLAKGKPEGLNALITSVREALKAEGIEEEVGHTAHVTICYRAPFPFASIAIEPIEWTIDELRLVRGCGQPYRYEVIARWPLAPAPRSQPPQLSLL